jgi:hypothetical protein
MSLYSLLLGQSVGDETAAQQLELTMVTTLCCVLPFPFQGFVGISCLYCQCVCWE